MKGFKLRDTPETHDYNYLDRNTNSTALMYACCSARVNDALNIIDIHKNDYKYLNAWNIYGITALMYAACCCDNTKIIDKLIECNVQIDAEDTRGCTAIYWAISSSNIDALKRLLEHKAKINFFSTTGISPLIFTLSSKILCTRQILYLLKQYGVIVQKGDFEFVANKIENELKKNNRYLDNKLEEQINSVISSLKEGDTKKIITTINESELYLDSYDILSALIDIDTRKNITLLNFDKEQPTTLETDLEISEKYSEMIKNLKIEIDEFYKNYYFENNEIFIQLEKLIQTLEDGEINEIIEVINSTDVFFEEFIKISELFDFKDKIKKSFKYSALTEIPHKKRNTENDSMIEFDFIKPKKYFKYQSIYHLLSGEQIVGKMLGY